MSTVTEYKRSARELTLHKAVVQLLKISAARGVMYYHVPNGESRSNRTGAKLKAMGVLPGVADLSFVLHGGRAAFLELKAPKGRLSDDQRAFRDVVVGQGALYAAADDLEQAQSILASWGALKGRPVSAEAA